MELSGKRPDLTGSLYERRGKQNVEKAYILGGLRSAIGIENGKYRHIPAEKLGAAVWKKLLEKYKLCTEEIDLVIAGNAVGAGGNLTRLMLLESGIGENIPAVTVDVQCGSGLESIAIAAAKIQSRQADVVIAGGFESSSTAPLRKYHSNHPDYEKYSGKDDWYRVAKFVPKYHHEQIMLEGAEHTAITEKITREEMDAWALRSHKMALKARENGILEDIIVSVGDASSKDEGIRERMSERLLKRLPPVLKDGKLITAGNACLTHDGAAFVILCSERFHQLYKKRTGQQAQAFFVQEAQSAGDPMKSPVTAITAIEKLLAKTNLKAEQIAAWECNEAFSAIDVLFERRFPDQVQNYNVFGGALAYGHPYGASGGMILLHLLKAMQSKKGEYGICSVAAAGGVGTALLLQRYTVSPQ